jgi:hypothetical protein
MGLKFKHEIHLFPVHLIYTHSLKVTYIVFLIIVCMKQSFIVYNLPPVVPCCCPQNFRFWLSRWGLLNLYWNKKANGLQVLSVMFYGGFSKKALTALVSMVPSCRRNKAGGSPLPRLRGPSRSWRKCHLKNLMTSWRCEALPTCGTDRDSDCMYWSI